MKHFALIGKRLGHSWSQRWFEAMFVDRGLEGYSYELHEMPSLDGLREWVTRCGIAGFNVTVPYKQAVIPLLDSLSPTAEAIGAVNCVCVEGGRLIGHNTDAPAFSDTFPLPGDSHSALILGTGGAARAVAYALGGLGVASQFVSRRPESCGLPQAIDYNEAAACMDRFDVLVNATPVGMWPEVDASPWPWPLEGFSLVYDLIYNPSPTLLLRRAAEGGAAVRDGLTMLQRQAELSWRLWQ